MLQWTHVLIQSTGTGSCDEMIVMVEIKFCCIHLTAEIHLIFGATNEYCNDGSLHTVICARNLMKGMCSSLTVTI